MIPHYYAFSLWVKKQYYYCDWTKIDEISRENTGGQNSGGIFSDYIRLVFLSSFLSFCVFTRNLYNLRTIELTKDEYSVFHCKQKNCCKKTNLIMHQPDDCFFSFPYIKFNCAQILQLWRNSLCYFFPVFIFFLGCAHMQAAS